MPNIDPVGVANAFESFFSIGPISWGISILVGGAAAAFITRLIISAFWR